MARQNIAFLAWNRGLVDKLGLARADIKRLALSAQVFNNYMARVLGSMMLRPGLQYRFGTLGNLATRYLPFVYSLTDKALVEITPSNVRVSIGDAIVMRVAVATAVTNGTFPANLGSWTQNDEAGAVSAWAAPNYMGLTGTGTNAAIRDQQVAVAAGDLAKEQALRIVVARGPILLRVGTSTGDDSYISETRLDTGTHSLAVTPTGDIYIRFMNRNLRVAYVSNCTIEAAGAMTIPTKWAAADIGLVRATQSGDILFCACGKTTDKIGYRQQKIERRAPHSWSVVDYQTDDGPFRVPNVGPITIAPSVLSGNGTLTASKALFKATHVGALFAITSTGQTVAKTMAALNDATGSIRVDSVGTQRAITIVISGITVNRTVILQQSFDNATWTAVPLQTWTTNISTSYNDALDNAIVYYRLICLYSTAATITQAVPGVVTYVGADQWAIDDPVSFSTTGGLPAPLIAGTTYYVRNLNAGANTFELALAPAGASITTTSAGAGVHTAYASGAPGNTVATLSIGVGSIRGVCRVTDFTNSMTLGIEILKAFGSLTGTTNWEEGRWSDYRGWPTSVAFFEGRLCWSGRDSAVLSVSDGYYSFDPTILGDSGYIDRSIGTGPVDTINWMLPLQRLVLGGENSEFSCRSDALYSVVTPTNFHILRCSTQGSAAVDAIQIDTHGIYVQRGSQRVFELSLGGDFYSYDYASTHLSALVPRIGAPGIVRVGLQRQPDTRVHFVRSDGTVAILVFDKTENVTCWLTASAGGTGAAVEDVVTLPGDPGTIEDQVYYVVKRTINGATARYLERWAIESDCIGAALNKQADSFMTFASGTIPTVPHLIGQNVVVWQDGVCQEDANGDPLTFLVDGAGHLTGLGPTPTTCVVGLPYTAQWQSGKLVELQNQLGLALTQQKEINGLGLIAADMHRRGIKFGPDFNNLDDLPSAEDDIGVVNDDTVWADYDQQPFIFPGKWSTDARLCLQSQAPRPVTILCCLAESQFHA